MNVKRARVNHQIESRKEYRSTTDCYDEALSGQLSSSKAVLSSWFGQDTTSALYRDGHSAQHGICQQNYETTIPDLHLEISQLSRQLLESKRRLGQAPIAAENTGVVAPITFAQARHLCNPYETLGQGCDGGLNSLFMNRSAMKLANLDHLMGFSLTNPVTSNSDFFSFVDLCGAPGGFSEYLMRRCIHRGHVRECRGYGMSLAGTNEHGTGLDWKLGDFVEEPYQGLRTCYHVHHGVDGTGDVMKWQNVVSLQSAVQAAEQAYIGNAIGKVDLVVADGGVDSQRNAVHQEGITQKLVVCQMATALELLKPGGTFVVKMFGFQTDVIQGAMHSLLEEYFEGVMALKPISSRPASAERYVAFVGFRGLGDQSGQKWMNRVFLGHPRIPTNIRLERYLSEFDKNLLTLNLKACNAMASCLAMQCWDCRCQVEIDVEDYTLLWKLR